MFLYYLPFQIVYAVYLKWQLNNNDDYAMLEQFQWIGIQCT